MHVKALRVALALTLTLLAGLRARGTRSTMLKCTPVQLRKFKVRRAGAAASDEMSVMPRVRLAIKDIQGGVMPNESVTECHAQAILVIPFHCGAPSLCLHALQVTARSTPRVRGTARSTPLVRGTARSTPLVRG